MLKATMDKGVCGQQLDAGPMATWPMTIFCHCFLFQSGHIGPWEWIRKGWGMEKKSLIHTSPLSVSISSHFPPAFLKLPLSRRKSPPATARPQIHPNFHRNEAHSTLSLHVIHQWIWAFCSARPMQDHGNEGLKEMNRIMTYQRNEWLFLWSVKAQ